MKLCGLIKRAEFVVEFAMSAYFQAVRAKSRMQGFNSVIDPAVVRDAQMAISEIEKQMSDITAELNIIHTSQEVNLVEKAGEMLSALEVIKYDLINLDLPPSL